MKTITVSSIALLLAFAGSAAGDSVSIDFENPPYVTGTIDLQDGWSSFGASGSGCALYDHAVTDNTGAAYSYPSFDDQSLRMSNAVTSGCFGDQTFSKSLADEAGESGAANGGFSGGTRQAAFEATWEFASTVPTAQQSGLSVVASPDRGDGARMGWVQMTDTPAGLEVNFFDYQSGAVVPGCDGSNFIFTNVASGLDRTVPHSIRVTMALPDGPGNDVVGVFVDGVLEHVGTSWEDFFRECQGPDTRTVDSVLFRTAGTAAPGTAGKGFVIDNLSLSSGPDGDGDGVTDARDNCPSMPNLDQNDADGDGAGDACDPCPLDPNDDADGDGFCADVDNCPADVNADQADADGDGSGDVCDNCTCVPNAGQEDGDEDGAGDTCDVLPDVSVGQCVVGPNLLVPQADTPCVPPVGQVCL